MEESNLNIMEHMADELKGIFRYGTPYEGMTGKAAAEAESEVRTGFRRVLEIEGDVYRRLASALVEAVGDSHYYNGTIDADCESFYSTLTATLIVYRGQQPMREESAEVITDVVPVWWEFSTSIPGEGEVLNDFSFRYLRDAVVSVG